jgi:hypothetical protein
MDQGVALDILINCVGKLLKPKEGIYIGIQHKRYLVVKAGPKIQIYNADKDVRFSDGKLVEVDTFN